MGSSKSFWTPSNCVSPMKRGNTENKTNKKQTGFFQNTKTRLMSLPKHTHTHMIGFLGCLQNTINLIMLTVKRKC